MRMDASSHHTDSARLDAVFAATRRHFDLPEGVIYLDGNSLGPLTRSARSRVVDELDAQWGPRLIKGWNESGWIDLPRAVGDRIAQGCVDLPQILTVNLNHVPAIGGKALADVLRGKGQIGGAFDGNLIVVIEANHIVEAIVSGQRGGFGSHSLHHAAVAGQQKDALIEQLFRTEACRQVFTGHRHADTGRESGTQRPGGNLHPRHMPVLRVSRSAAAPLPEIAQVFSRQPILEQVKQRIDQHRAMTGRQNKPVATRPLRLPGIVPQVFVPQGEGVVGAPHGQAGMAGIGLLHAVGGKRPHRVYRFTEDILIDHGKHPFFP